MVEMDDVVVNFLSFPKRLFFDSCTLQYIQKYGDFIWDNVVPPPGDKIYTSSGGAYKELQALHDIWFTNQRNNLDFVISAASLEEVDAKGDYRYLQWAFDMLDYWQARLDEYAEYDVQSMTGRGEDWAAVLNNPSIGFLSSKDKKLIRDAVLLECDAFLTMETKLPKIANTLREHVPLSILRPSEYWKLLKPWAPLFI